MPCSRKACSRSIIFAPFFEVCGRFPAKMHEPPQPTPIPVLALGKLSTGPARTPHAALVADVSRENEAMEQFSEEVKTEFKLAVA
jgi:hypothetical protein